MLTLLLTVLTARAQSADEAWRTVETEHYRLHYPADSEDWARHTAQHLEAIRALVTPEIGFEPTQTVDIVVMDPYAQANGFAMPFLNGPRMGIFPTAPEPSSGIGHYRSWSEDLIVHEDAHLVHLLRPSRNPAMQIFLGLLGGVSPISLNSPAWVIEGYATVVEGRLTGLGRPNSDSRAALLRALAAQGQLPSYAGLDGSDRWSSQSYRYLIGSAYLEWLVDRSGNDDALRALWARMTAAEIRTFEEAFVGVFGAEPATLYARFSAELTHDALQLEEHRPADEGTLFQDLARSTGAPDVSPSGAHVSTILRPADAPPELVVWEAGEDAEAAERWQEGLPDLENDPEDVAPVPPEAFAREPTFSHTIGGGSPWRLRWIDDDTLLFTDFMTDGDGDRYPELFTWTLSTDRIQRITRGGHVRDADPHGTRAVALRTRHGLSELVSVDLITGDIVPLISGGPAEVYASPRISPDGRQVSWLHNSDGWAVVVSDLDGDTLTEPVTVPLPQGRSILSIDWHPDGSGLVASLGFAGFIELYTLPLSGVARQLTISDSGALAPAFTPDGEAVFFLSPDVAGMDLHRLEIARSRAEGWDDEQLRRALTLRSAAAPPPPPPPAPPLDVAAVTPRRYGIGRPEIRLTAGGISGPEQRTGEIGLRVGDVIGRHELIAFYSGRAEDSGARAALTYRGLPIRLRLDGALLDLSTPVVELSAARRHHWRHGGVEASAGAWRRDGGISGGGTAALGQRWWTGSAWWGGELSGEAAAGSAGLITTGSGALSAGYNMASLSVSARQGRAASTPFVLGGLPDPLQPELSDLSFAWAPGFAPGTDASTELRHLRGELGLWDALYVFGERYDLVSSHSQIGIEARLYVPPQPLVRLVALEVSAGLSCHLSEDTLTPPQACTLSEGISGWLGILMRPGRTVYLPDR